MLSANPKASFLVAKRGVHYTDSQARWQIAVLLGRLGTSNAVELLKGMTSDADEYVRRRALLSVRDVDSAFAESIAIEWLESEYEYSRMVALDTLAVLNSPYLSEAMRILENDPSPVVQNQRLQVDVGFSSTS